MPKTDISPVQNLIEEFNAAVEIVTQSAKTCREFVPVCGKPGGGYKKQRELIRAHGIVLSKAAEYADALRDWATQGKRGPLAESTAKNRVAALVAAIPSAPNGNCACGGCKLLEICGE